MKSMLQVPAPSPAGLVEELPNQIGAFIPEASLGGWEVWIEQFISAKICRNSWLQRMLLLVLGWGGQLKEIHVMNHE